MPRCCFFKLAGQLKLLLMFLSKKTLTPCILTDENVRVILLSLSAIKVSLKIDVHYEGSREAGPNSSLSITVNVRGMREMVNQNWQKSEELVDNRRLVLISLMKSVTWFSRMEAVSSQRRKVSLFLGQSIELGFHVQVKRGNAQGEEVPGSALMLNGAPRTLCRDYSSEARTPPGSRAFGQHLCPWSRERLCEHWTSFPCGSSLRAAKHQPPSPAGGQHCSAPWGCPSPALLSGPAVHQQRPQSVRGGLQTLFPHWHDLLLSVSHILLETHIASTAADGICLLGFWGGCVLGRLCVALWGIALPAVSSLGCLETPVPLSQPACAVAVALGCGQGLEGAREHSEVGLPLSGQAGAHLKALGERGGELQ